MKESLYWNIGFLEEQYEKYKHNPESIHTSWRHFFEGWDLAVEKGATGLEEKYFRIFGLVEAYRKYGHLKATINPIALFQQQQVLELTLGYHGLNASDLDLKIAIPGFFNEQYITLKELIDLLEKIYCSSIGFEYMDLQRPDLERWIQDAMESRGLFSFSKEDKISIFFDLCKAEFFENFLHTRYSGQKRFSLEGAETLIPMLSFLLESASDEGIQTIILGMAHRGRLNILAHILNKSYGSIFQEFDENYVPDFSLLTGDVKYHKGFHGSKITKKGNKIDIILSANPSHLESVNPVVIGQVRAQQDREGLASTMGVLIHGDASIAGQGVVYETLQMSKLKGYETQGTLHIVINNQIGFTTPPKEGRSTKYCTDIAAAFKVPVFHVNAEDPEACISAMILALKIRQHFKSDVFIDLNCYRKYGHNEGDEATFTQPLEYQIIQKKISIRALYSQSLEKQQLLDRQGLEQIETSLKSALQNPQDNSRESVDREKITQMISLPQITQHKLLQVVSELCKIPNGFKVHPKIEKLLISRKNLIEDSTDAIKIDWALAESLAFAVILSAGVSIRFSGQDCCRGTFSHRHAIWVDQTREEKNYCPLSHLTTNKARFQIFNSPLSEFSVLGFEFGYSLSSKATLVLWEAQYGDFVNEAQVIIDQYISSSEKKWGFVSTITLLLPHGYEGQGPEHSSARLERFLQLSAENNWSIVNCTTAAQFYHVICRQVKLEDQKPLILFTPKKLLRYTPSMSLLKEFTDGHFQKIIDDPLEDPCRVLLCSGKIYYDLLAERKEKNVAIIRIEQLYPLDPNLLRSLYEKYRNIHSWFWVQEEPKNSGAWNYISPFFQKWIDTPINYIGPEEMAASAAGTYALHKKQYTEILKQVYKDI